MSTTLTVITVLVAWFLVSIPFGIFVGRCIAVCQEKEENFRNHLTAGLHTL